MFKREVHGPLKLFKESYLKDDDQLSLADQVAKLHHRMTNAIEIARADLKVPPKRTKTWYDQQAWNQSFKARDKISILLTVQGQPLQARYIGPFMIGKKINDVDYVVYTPGRCKEKCLCYVNILKRGT